VNTTTSPFDVTAARSHAASGLSIDGRGGGGDSSFD